MSGIPVPVSDRHKPFEKKSCARCLDDEFRIDGYCSVYCQDMAELEKALQYCYDDKECMQNQIDVLVANNDRLRGLFGDFDFFPTVEQCEEIWKGLMETKNDLAK